MRHSRALSPPAALLLAAVLAPAAHAADRAVYGGLGLGYAAQEIEQPGLLVGPGQTLSRDIEGSDLATRVFAGVRLHRHLAIEAGWVDLGEVDALVPLITSDFQFVQAPTNVETSGLEVTVLGIWPVNRDFEVYGKLGLVSWDSDLATAGVGTVSSDGQDLAYGFGAEYVGTGRLRFRIEGMVYDLDGFDESITVTASVLYSFPFGR
jgi:OOP family OmpA-OmpF porin